MNNYSRVLFICIFSFAVLSIHAQRNLVHPGLSHKQSDLDRMRLMVQSKKEPWYASYLELAADGNAQYTYVVKGNNTMSVVTQDGTNYSAFSSDTRAAYLNALMYMITQDERHAAKCVEIFNAWVNLTEFTGGGTESLNAGRVIWKMVEAAEIIRYNYDGWSEEDIEKFEAMLVYPGYSNTAVPASLSGNNGTFYWRMYNGDPARHGNQDMFGFRGVMAIGVFLDNEIMYERALRYYMGLPHRADDLPYASGPGEVGSVRSENDYFIYTNSSQGSVVEDYGYNGVLEHYIWENGQLQESSRDQDHGILGLGMTASLAEIAWNQGDDVYSMLDNRILKGYEFSLHYNVSYSYSYPDQEEPWEPTVENGQFIQRQDRTGRWYSKAVNPHYESNFVSVSRGNFHSDKRPIYELAIGHYRDRIGLAEDALKWTMRAHEISLSEVGYEKTGWSHDHLGWGALTVRRPNGCPGDPVTYLSGFPDFEMNYVPGTIEAEDFDFFTGSGNSHTYHDSSDGNSGGAYRLDEDADIKATENGFALTDLEAGEWYQYTIYVPLSRAYDLYLNYSATAEGLVSVSIDGNQVVNEFLLSNTSTNEDYTSIKIGENIELEQGVQNLTIYINASDGDLNLDSWSMQTSVNIAPDLEWVTPHYHAAFVQNGNVKLSVDASDIDGSISNVSFYANDELISTMDTDPFELNWQPSMTGVVSLKAEATDDKGAVTDTTLSIVVYPEGEDQLLRLEFDHQIIDQSGNNIQVDAEEGYLFGSGKDNAALLLDGNSYLTLEEGFLDDVMDFTFSGWVMVSDPASFASIFDFGASTASYMSLIPNPVTNKLRYIVTNNGVTQQLNASEVFPQEEWTHIAISQFGDDAKLFINGEIVDETNSFLLNPAALSSFTTNYIGHSRFASVENLSASLDRLTFYKRGLSSEEILALYESQLKDVTRPQLVLENLGENVIEQGSIIKLATSVTGETSRVSLYEGVNLIETKSTSPYEFDLTDWPVGKYIFSAKAENTLGFYDVSEFMSVTIEEPNVAPEIFFSSPSQGSIFESSDQVTVTINATDSDGSIANVSIWLDEQDVQILTTTPYEYIYSNLAEGNYVIKACAQDDDGVYSDTISVSFSIFNPLNINYGESFKLYPNPATDYLMINTPANIDLQSIQIFNLLGQHVAEFEGIGHGQNINISFLKSGLYLVKFITSEIVFSEHLIIH